MKKTAKIIGYIVVFILVFGLFALVRIGMLGSGPTKLFECKFDDSVGVVQKDIEYKNSDGNKVDLYLPTDTSSSNSKYLMFFLHGGSFNSGVKEDMDAMCKFYCAKGYTCATVDYTLQNHGKDASINLMNEQILSAVEAVKTAASSKGVTILGMAPVGVSAGGTLALNLGYSGKSCIPVKFVCQMSAPVYFEPGEWGLLKFVDHLSTDADFVNLMCGTNFTDEELSGKDCVREVNKISPCKLVNKTTVPTLCAYGLIDHCVPLDQKQYLFDAFDRAGVKYDYIEFPNSNHGMYNDLDKLQQFIDMSLDYALEYFK